MAGTKPEGTPSQPPISKSRHHRPLLSTTTAVQIHKDCRCSPLRQSKQVHAASGEMTTTLTPAGRKAACCRCNRMAWPSVPKLAKSFNARKAEDYPIVVTDDPFGKDKRGAGKIKISKFYTQGAFDDFQSARDHSKERGYRSSAARRPKRNEPKQESSWPQLAFPPLNMAAARGCTSRSSAASNSSAPCLPALFWSSAVSAGVTTNGWYP